jgi:hypothetical protein
MAKAGEVYILAMEQANKNLNPAKGLTTSFWVGAGTD